MDNGWIKLHKKITQSDIWFLEPFTKAQAWVDLLLSANFKDSTISVRGNIIKVKRGQLAWSEVTMSKRWAWSRNKTRRFLNWLKTEQMVKQQKNRQTSITTIVNYNLYQETIQQTEQQTIQQKDNRKTTDDTQHKKVKKEEKVKENKYSPEFEQFWSKYPRKIGKEKAGKSYSKLLKDHEQIMQGLEMYQRWWEMKDTKPEYIPHPTTWLNGSRWLDDLGIAPKQMRKTNFSFSDLS